MFYKLLSSIFILVSLTAIAQVKKEAVPIVKWQEVSFRHDNDFIFAIDRYYTAGSFISYSKQLEGDFLFEVQNNVPMQFDLTLGQETYTPRELFETEFNRLERPYAGYLFLRAGLSQGKRNRLLKVDLELGLVGEQSLSRKFQLAYHELINEFIPVWSGQIANNVHVNTYASYVRDYQIPNSNLFKNIALQSTIALGTRRIFARQEALLYIGKRDRIVTSSAFGRLGEAEEFYGFAGGSVEYVFLNALIQGHPWGDNSPFTLPVVSTIFSLKAGMTYRGLHNTYSIVYNLRTKETEREGRSQYVALEFARKF